MTKRSSKTHAEDLGLVGEDAVDVLLAALGSRPKKSAGSSSKISSSKIKRSKEKRKFTKEPSPEGAVKEVEKCSTPKLTETDVRLRMMVAASEPGRCYTLQEIAEVVGVSRERIRQLEFQALRS